MTDGPVRLLNVFQALEGHEAEAEQIARRILEVAEAHPQVLQVQLFRDQGDPTRFVSLFEFQSQAGLEEYLGSDSRREALAELPKHVGHDFQRFVLEPLTVRART